MEKKYIKVENKVNKKMNKINKDKENKEKIYIKYTDKLLIFFNKDIKKKFIVLLIVSVILLMLFTNFMYNINKFDITTGELTADVNNNLVLNRGFFEILKSKLMVLGLTLVAGVVPYFFIPVVGLVGYLLTTGSEVSINILGYQGNFSVLTLIPLTLDVICISLATSIGIYYASVSTKKFIYSGTKRFTLLDLKLQIYEIMKKEEKIEKIKNKIERRNEKQEKNNVKTKYIEMISIFGIVIIIQFISVLIDVLIR